MTASEILAEIEAAEATGKAQLSYADGAYSSSELGTKYAAMATAQFARATMLYAKLERVERIARQREALTGELSEQGEGENLDQALFAPRG